MSLGKRIRELRDARDLSLREFATKLGVSAPFVSDIELGRRYPSEKVLQAIAAVLGVNLDDLKAHDTRAPVEEMKQRVAANPRYALAFRTLIDRNLSPDELIEIANRSRPSNSKKKPL